MNIVGTARRIQYTMNNTDLVNGYNPEPCFVDWPPNKDANGEPLYKWEISHCPNLVIDFCISMHLSAISYAQNILVSVLKI